jgi:hypothetical protein
MTDACLSTTDVAMSIRADKRELSFTEYGKFEYTRTPKHDVVRMCQYVL